jgi:YHS domain-containing protein
MNKTLRQTSAVCVAAFISISAPQTIRRFDTRIKNVSRESRRDDPIILAQAQTQKRPSPSEASSKIKLNVDNTGLILKGYDPVAYFKQRKAVKGSPSITSTYQGATYQFASKVDKSEFDRNPSNYVPQYGGFCAYNMTKGQMQDCDPTVFFIYKGKLYLCSSPEAEKSFRRNTEKSIEEADRSWRQLIGS